jgi:aminopeptidase-like protein
METESIFNFAKQIFLYNRSLTGNGVRATLKDVKKICPTLKVKEIKSGKKVFDWVIPLEWNIDRAFIIKPDGFKICDYSKNNLHLVGYSQTVNKIVSLNELQEHLYSIPNQPTAIPYVTSYYADNWGFCMSENERASLVEGDYHVIIEGKKDVGAMSYGEIYINGKSKKEILISTYVCHPSMANNEVSGISVTTYLAAWLSNLQNRFFSYRILFIPETIGSIMYLSKHKNKLKRNVVAGFNVTCVGDNRKYSFLPSRAGSTIADRVAKHVLKNIDNDYVEHTWAERGSDERQYCSPLIDLPIVSIMRTKYGCYPEYHTSLDTLGDVVTPEGLNGAFDAIQKSILCLENNLYPLITNYCEPMLSKRNLYPSIAIKSNDTSYRIIKDILTWSDGTKSILEIAEKTGLFMLDLLPIIDNLKQHELLKLKRHKNNKI